jgi:2'-5' RNA ligase
LESLYFIAVVPPEDIREEVTELKKYVAATYGSKHALKSPPHITLHMPFKFKDRKYEQLEAFLQSMVKNQPTFSIQLQGFSYFEPRVVFVDMLQSEALESLQATISKEIRQLNILNSQYKGRPFHPHMTIAFRDLKKQAFYEARNDFSQKEYSRNFEVEEICLLKHDGQQWNIHQRIPFS